MPNATIQQGWSRVVFGDVVRLCRERSSNPENDGFDRYVGLEHLEPGDLKIRSWGNTADGTTFTNVFHSGQVLFGKRRAYQRKVAVPDFNGVCSGDIYVLEPTDDHLIAELLPYICQTDGFFDHAVGTSSGSLSPRTNWQSLASYEFALPPIDEQRRIARILKEVDASVEGLLQLNDSLFAMAAALVEDAIRDAPDSAAEKVINLLLEPPRNGVSPPGNAEGRGLRTVSLSAIRNGVFDPTGYIKHVDISPAVARPFFVERGDCFVIRGNGNRNLCGKAGLSNHSFDNLFYPDLLIRLRFNPDRILPEFAVAQWNLPSVHGRLVAMAKSSNGIWKVNGQDIRAHQLIAPPMAEQTRVMETLIGLRRVATAVSARRNLTGELKAEVLKRALIA